MRWNGVELGDLSNEQVVILELTKRMVALERRVKELEETNARLAGQVFNAALKEARKVDKRVLPRKRKLTPKGYGT